MKILIEEYQYNYEDVKDVLSGLGVLQDVAGKVSLNYVGYYYSPVAGDCVFILPKVILQYKEDKKEELAFGRIHPRKLIDADRCEELTKEEHDFIYGLAVWIYRAIKVYKDNNKESDIVLHQLATQMGNKVKRKSNTFLDILLALQDFNEKNQQFFFFVVKNLHSGFNKINWTRTISKSKAFIGKKPACVPIYLDPVNKKREINFDEELLIIFFSILHHMHEEYGFPVKISLNFPLIKDSKFERYLNGYGKTRLLQIKYKYFSDKALYLWNLCYAFFDHPHKIDVNIDQREYLLVKSFHVVFEAIIDHLIVGDHVLPKELQEQEDGKRVDHLYKYDALIKKESSKKEEIYYIGDSKYYKQKTPLSTEAIAKQFTYARNVIQWNMDLFLDDSRKEEQKKEIKLRDDITEGYNIIPNFFISANQNELKPVADITPETSKEIKDVSRQFENRLFDRDTLLLAYYNVNFLYIIQLYGRDNKTQQASWRKNVRDKFRNGIRKMLEDKYQFYCMVAKEDVNGELALRDNFLQMLGKVFTPYPTKNGENRYYSLALEQIADDDTSERASRVRKENKEVLDWVDAHFNKKEIKLGEDPREILPVTYPPYTLSVQKDASVLVVESTMLDEFVSIIKSTKKLGIALQGDSGKILRLAEGFTSATLLLVTNKNTGQLFWLEKGPYLEPSPAEGAMALTKKGATLYLVYNVSTNLQAEIGTINYDNVKSLFKNSDPKRHYDSHMVTVEFLTRKS